MAITQLKIIIRYLFKNKTLTSINVAGLTLGFTCFILLGLYVHDELTFDAFHRDADRIARVLQHEVMEGGELRSVAQVAARIAPEMKSQFPEVESYMRLAEYGRVTMGTDPTTRDYEHLIVADSNFFEFFDFKLIEGNSSTALINPNALVISERIAKKYFGNEPAMGKTIQANQMEMVVTGIMEDFPTDSHFSVEVIFSEATMYNYFTQYREFETSDWTSNNFVTYMKVHPGADIELLGERLTDLVRKNYPPDETFASSYELQPLRSIHVNAENIQGYAGSTIKPFYVYMFGAVAILILLIACLNYMNLSTAVAFQRTREIGTRKTLGAAKRVLISQFILEALILALVALCLSVIVLTAILPEVNVFLKKELSLTSISWYWALVAVGFILVMAALSALYPAIVVSRVSPAEAIKSEIRVADRSIPVRKMLVVGQFAIAIVMISSTLLIHRQLQFMKEKELGFNVQDLLVIDINSGTFREKFEEMKTKFLSMPQVQSAAVSSRVPGEWKLFPVATVENVDDPVARDMIYVAIDDDFLATYDINLKEGRNFTNHPGDSAKVILTELAAEQLGLENPLGKLIEIPSVRFGGNIQEMEAPFKAEVIGVASDFYFESFRNEQMPLIFAYWNNPIHSIDYFTLRLSTSNWPETLAGIRSVGDEFDDANPIEYNFLESKFGEFYEADERRGQIFLVFALTIVLIACMGLFALVSFSIQRRQKEIGVRKVLGASVANILHLISKEFVLLIGLACLIAVPLTWLLMKDWLHDFAYRVPVGAGIFVFSGAVALGIAIVTIVFRTIRAAMANPVDSLRSE